MQHSDILLQHSNETCNMHIKHLKHTFATCKAQHVLAAWANRGSLTRSSMLARSSMPRRSPVRSSMAAWISTCAELTDDTWLAGGSARKALRRRIDTGDTKINGSVCGAQWGGWCRWRGVRPVAGMRKPMGWSVWTEVAQRRTLGGVTPQVLSMH
jgi:hypothetical protein